MIWRTSNFSHFLTCAPMESANITTVLAGWSRVPNTTGACIHGSRGKRGTPLVSPPTLIPIPNPGPNPEPDRTSNHDPDSTPNATLVDAGMRELRMTGWMTQSVRMICASFLVEYLRVNWVDGAEWFADNLCDADPAINAMMWQNAGRSGIDQWNFVMSPENASQDPTGRYTRKFVPELARLQNKHLHKPWAAPAQHLKEAGVTLGATYPNRVVTDLREERRQSVEAVLDMRRAHQVWMYASCIEHGEF